MINSHQYIRHIFDGLFSPQLRRFEKSIDNMHREHCAITREQVDGFMFQGKFYRASTKLAGPGPRVTLDTRLWDQMFEHLKAEAAVEVDKSLIKQVLFRLIEPCQSLQEIRDALPECLVDDAPTELSALIRMNEPAHTLHRERDLRQYEQMLPRMQFYQAVRFIY